MISMPAIGGILVVACSVGGFFIGMDYKDKQYAEKTLTAQREQARIIAAQAARLNSLSAELEQAKTEAQMLFDSIETRADKVVDRPVYLSACFDDDGLRIANDALTRNATRTRKPDPAVPAATPAHRVQR